MSWEGGDKVRIYCDSIQCVDFVKTTPNSGLIDEDFPDKLSNYQMLKTNHAPSSVQGR
jgi:hypothetical protein